MNNVIVAAHRFRNTPNEDEALAWAQAFLKLPADERQAMRWRGRLAGRSASEAFNRTVRPRAAGAGAPDDDTKDQFRAAAAEHGLTLPGELITGKFQRFDPDTGKSNRKKDNCAYYILHLNGWPAGAFGDWRNGIKEKWHAKPNGHMPDETELRAHRDNAKKTERALELEIQKKQKEIAKETARLLDYWKDAPADHAYLLEKGVQAHGAKAFNGRLIIPLQDADGALWNWQSIDAKGGKLFTGGAGGGRVEGCFFLIGGPLNTEGDNCIGEGFATMATVHEDSGLPSIAGMDAGNVVAVAKALAAKYPAAKYPRMRWTVCADADSWTRGNPGETKAATAARILAGKVAVPVFAAPRPYGKTDFNDLHRAEGPEAVARCIALAKEPPPKPEDEVDTGEEESGLARNPKCVDGTDLINARLFVRQHSRNIRFVAQFKAWLVWDGVRWRADDTGEIERLGKQTVDGMLLDAMKAGDEDARKKAVAAAVKSFARRKIMDMIGLAESEKPVVITANELDADPNLLGVLNGAIDLRTDKFFEPSRDLYITKSCAVAYDPSAKCPEWDGLLGKITNSDPGLIAYLARVAGYLLSGSVCEEIAFILWGDGHNGKTTFRETFFRLLGDYAVAGKASMLTAEDKPGAPTPDMAQLKGVRLLAVNEMTKGAKINEERFKYLNGNDTMTARPLYKPPFSFQPTHKMVITTNHKPRVKDTDEGVWRRLQLIPFVVTISGKEKIENFRELKLMPELPGILNWALKGLADYRKNGLKPPEAVTKATQAYRASEDTIAQWFEDSCESDKEAQTPAANLHRSLKNFTDGEDTPSAIALGLWLENKNFERMKDTKGRRAWKGIKLKYAYYGDENG